MIFGVMSPLSGRTVEEQPDAQPERLRAAVLRVPPGLFGTAVQVTLVAWVVYSVGLNMHSIGLVLGLDVADDLEPGLLGLDEPAASPTALAADPAASMTIAVPQRPIAADPVIAPARAPPSLAEADDLLVDHLEVSVAIALPAMSSTALSTCEG